MHWSYLGNATPHIIFLHYTNSHRFVVCTPRCRFSRSGGVHRGPVHHEFTPHPHPEFTRPVETRSLVPTQQDTGSSARPASSAVIPPREVPLFPQPSYVVFVPPRVTPAFGGPISVQSSGGAPHQGGFPAPRVTLPHPPVRLTLPRAVSVPAPCNFGHHFRAYK